jgi:uncharacterized linocin/CFP29 family protein
MVGDSYLGRGDAPISAETWTILDTTMVEAAKSMLTGRRLLHLEGPFGLGLKAIPLQDSASEGALIRSGFAPVDLIQTSFSLSKRDLAAYERDGMLPNTAAVAMAAIDAARQEDAVIFTGTEQVKGLMNADGSQSVKLSNWEKIGVAADDLIKAVTALDLAGFHGPYALALSPARYNLLFRRYPQGSTTELEHLQQMVTDGIFKAPVLGDGGVLIASGQQYAAIVLGQDMTIGYTGPSQEALDFTISESLALLIREPRAICVLK